MLALTLNLEIDLIEYFTFIDQEINNDVLGATIY